MDEKKPTLIHVAKIFKDGGWHWLFLRLISERHYQWFTVDNKWNEEATDVVASTSEEAMRLAHRQWSLDHFRTLICGFRYNLPERDEHGMNALFHQMAKSLNTVNGHYFDEELGHNCFVQNASLEARELLTLLTSLQKI